MATPRSQPRRDPDAPAARPRGLARGFRQAGARQRRRRPAPLRAGHPRRRARAQPRADAGHPTDDLRERPATARGAGDGHRKWRRRRSPPKTSAGRAATSSPPRSSATCCCAGSRDAGATETILLRGGMLTEGSASSAHVVKDGRVITPPQTNAILPGTTRGVILELAGREGIPSERRPVTEGELRYSGRTPHRLRGRRHPRHRDARRPPGRNRHARARVPEDLRRLQGHAAGNSRPTCRHDRHRRAVPVSLRIPDQGDGPRLGRSARSRSRSSSGMPGRSRPIASASA